MQQRLYHCWQAKLELRLMTAEIRQNCREVTSSGQLDVTALKDAQSTHVGGHTEVLKNEGTSQEVQVVDVGAEGR